MSKHLYELGPNSEVAVPSDIPVVPTLVSSFGNDVGYVTTYSKATLTPSPSGTAATATLLDRTVNNVTVADGTTSLTLVFPSEIQAKARDFLLRLVVQGSTPPTVYLPQTAVIDFGEDSLEDIDTGINLILFSEIDTNHWLVETKGPES